MKICLRRREFIAGLGGAATWPLAAWAQRLEMPVIGLLQSGGPSSWDFTGFRQGLKEKIRATSKAQTWRLRFAGRMTIRFDCGKWPPIWSTVGCA